MMRQQSIHQYLTNAARQRPILILFILALLAISACRHNEDTSAATDEDPPSQQEPDTADLPRISLELQHREEITADQDGDPIIPEDIGTIAFTVTLSKVYNQSVSVLFFAVGNENDDVGESLSATLNNDFIMQGTGNKLIFAAGETVKTFNIGIGDDKINETNLRKKENKDLETFFVTLGRAERAVIDSEKIVLSIRDNDPPPEIELTFTHPEYLNLEEITKKESDGKIELSINLTSNSVSMDDIHVPIKFGGSAVAGSDFVNLSEVVIPAGEDTISFPFFINDDATANEPNETIEFQLLPPDNATLSGQTTIIIILLDDEGNGHINDTGVTACAIDDNFSTSCDTAQDFPQQDAMIGPAEFNFTKIKEDGTELTAEDSDTHACVKDNNTNLIWEVKHPRRSGHMQDYQHRYTWHNPLNNSNGGDAGPTGASTGCGAEVSPCDTFEYIEAINQIKYVDETNQIELLGLCGLNNWRLPKITELMSIVDFSGPVPGINNTVPLIDENFFPNTNTAFYWTATPAAIFAESAWRLDFRTGKTDHQLKAIESSVRLVSSGNSQ